MGPGWWRVALLLLLLAGVFAGLRGISALPEPPQVATLATDRVVVVGVTGRPALTPADREVLGAHLDESQVGAIAIRPRYVGRCAAAGWTTLGAGRRANEGGLCDPQVVDGRVTDWAERVAAAAARNGDAQLGTLAASVSGCVAAVGPGAALAAARPDGTVADYQTADAFVAGGLTTRCPITLVDAGGLSDQIIRTLAADDEITVIVTGVGPDPGSDDPGLQVMYRLGTTFPGWLTSASTRRVGIVTLTDLTRTLIDFDRPASAPPPLTVDGSPLAVYPAELTIDGVEAMLRSVAALSDAIPAAYLILGSMGAVVVAVGVVSLLRRRLRLSLLMWTVSASLSSAMLLTGAVPWQRSSMPVLALGLAVAVGWAIATVAAVLIGRLLAVPAMIAAAGLAVAALTIDAALGGPLQPGSLLNSRPIFGLRWYGFGNTTFAAYATNGLLLAGYIAHRMLAAGRRRAAVAAVAAIGFGIVICQGWPSMGSDFGGVIALTPPVLWLILVISGVSMTWPRLLLVGGSAVLAIGLISTLDWLRGPDRRSHLGNFVQRILDGDALDVVSRKAVASVETIASPLGLFSLLFGAAVFFLALRWVAPRIESQFSTVRPVLIALLATGILGTVLNDAGIAVWLTVSIIVAVAMTWFSVDQAARTAADVTRPAARRR